MGIRPMIPGCQGQFSPHISKVVLRFEVLQTIWRSILCLTLKGKTVEIKSREIRNAGIGRAKDQMIAFAYLGNGMRMLGAMIPTSRRSEPHSGQVRVVIPRTQ